MEKIGRLIKELSQDYLERNLSQLSCLFVVNYIKLSAPQLNTLRSALRDAHAGRLLVIKNNIARRVFKTKGWDDLVPFLDGPCGVVIGKDDPVTLSKAIFNFMKDNEGLQVKAGVLMDTVISHDDFLKLAKLPNRQMLYAQIVNGFKMPIVNLVWSLKQITQKLVYVLDKIKEGKQKGGQNG